MYIESFWNWQIWFLCTQSKNKTWFILLESEIPCMTTVYRKRNDLNMKCCTVDGKIFHSYTIISEVFVLYNFPFLFCLPWTWLFMSNWAGVSRKHRGRLLYQCTWSMPPVFSCSFTFVTLYKLFWLFYVFLLLCVSCFPCLLFVPGLHSMISTRILVPLV